MARSTEQVFRDHMSAIARGDLAAVLDDYADDAVLITAGQVFSGKEEIQQFFIQAYTAFPGLTITSTGEQVHRDGMLVTWSGDSNVARITTGVDTFVIRDGTIRLQTVWYIAAPK